MMLSLPETPGTNLPIQNSPSVNQKIFTESMTSYLTFINIKKNLGDERFDLVKHVVLLVYGDNCVMACDSDQAL